MKNLTAKDIKSLYADLERFKSNRGDNDDLMIDEHNEWRKKINYLIDNSYEPECVNIINALNSLMGVKVYHADSGKDNTKTFTARKKGAFHVWFKCSDFVSLQLITRQISRNYGRCAHWKCEAISSDVGCGNFVLHSNITSGVKAYREAEIIAKQIVLDIGVFYTSNLFKVKPKKRKKVVTSKYYEIDQQVKKEFYK